MRKKILILISLGWNVRNYLRSDVLDIIKKDNDVIIGIPYEDKKFIAEFKDKVNEIIILPADKSDKIMAPLKQLISYAYFTRVGDLAGEHRTKFLMQFHKVPQWKRLFHYFSKRISKVLSWTPVFKLLVKLELIIYKWLNSGSAQKILLKEINPDLIVSTFPFRSVEYSIIIHGMAMGKKTIASILSWDNLTTKGRFIGHFDKYLLWSEKMKDDLTKYHSYLPAQNYKITGTPQFDFYFSRIKLMNKADFMNKIGIDTNKHLLTYCCVPQHLVVDEQDIILQLYEELINSELKNKFHLIIRPHPLGDYSLYDKVAALPNASLSIPWEKDFSKWAWFYPSVEDFEILANTIYHSSVGYNIRSTMTLDFCIFNKPVVNIAFGSRNFPDSKLFIKDFYKYKYYEPIVRSKGAPICETPIDAVQKTIEYIEEPMRDKSGRNIVVQELCGVTDGNSGKRVASEILLSLNT